jgi:hypothetical protein
MYKKKRNDIDKLKTLLFGKDIESLPFFVLSQSLKKKHRADLIILYGALLYSYISFRPEQLGTLSLL